MRTHTAMHILCGVVFRDYGAQVTGGDMEPLKGRMDFEFENHAARPGQGDRRSGQPRGRCSARRSGSRSCRARKPSRSRLDPHQDQSAAARAFQQVRTVEIVGLDLQADGGTHVHNTAEVGQIRVVDYKSKGKINKRIYVELPEASK